MSGNLKDSDELENDDNHEGAIGGAMESEKDIIKNEPKEALKKKIEDLGQKMQHLEENLMTSAESNDPRIPCSFAKFGCKEILKNSCFRTHLKTCSFRQKQTGGARPKLQQKFRNENEGQAQRSKKITTQDGLDSRLESVETDFKKCHKEIEELKSKSARQSYSKLQDLEDKQKMVQKESERNRKRLEMTEQIIKEQGNKSNKDRFDSTKAELQQSSARVSQLEDGSLSSMDSGVESLELSEIGYEIGNQDQRMQLTSKHIHEVELQLQHMEHTSYHGYNGKFIWKVDHYAFLKEQAQLGDITRIKSNPFWTSKHGYKMCMCAHLDGKSYGKGTHISLSFCVMKGDWDASLPWPFCPKVTLMILDQSRNDNKTIAYSFKETVERPTAERDTEYSCDKFVLQSVIEDANSSYVIDDVLFIKAIVSTDGLENY